MLKKQGIQKTPIVVYNMDEDFDWKLAYVGCDYTQSGRLACGVSALLTNECGHVCILSFDSGNIPSSVDRIDGFRGKLQTATPIFRSWIPVFCPPMWSRIIPDSGERNVCQI